MISERFRAVSFLILLFAIVFLINACTGKKQISPETEISIIDISTPGYLDVIIKCSANSNISIEQITVELSENQSMKGADKYALLKTGNEFSVSITGLKPQTVYYYRYIVGNKAESYSDDVIRQFRTLDYSAPDVSTIEAVDISGTMALLKGKLVFSCGESISEQGFRIGTDKSKLESRPIETNDFTYKAEGLTPGSTYYYQAYVVSEIGTGEGEIKEFKTCDAVDFKELQINDITATGVSLSCGIKSDGGVSIEQQGFRYRESGNTNYLSESSTGELKLESLKASTDYIVWFFAKTFEGEYESEKVQFTTMSGLATLGTMVSTKIDNTSVELSCEVLSDGGASIMERGLCYSPSPNPSVYSSRTPVDGELGPLSGTITGLTPGSKYYIRAYVTTSLDTIYSNELEITTKAVLPTMASVTVTGNLATSISLSSSIASSGDGYILEKGYCYNTQSNPDINSSKVYVNSGWMTSISGLTPNTTYYIRSYATTQYGTAYSDQVQVTTKDFSATVSTLDATGLGLSSAVLNGTLEIENNAWLSSSEVWFLYSDTASDVQSLKASGKRASATLNGNSYSLSINGLKECSMYYFIACAKVFNKELYGDVRAMKIAAVDLGLSVKWAACNVGASAPEGLGEYYAWGEIATKTSYTASTYKWGVYPNIKKYNTLDSYGTKDGKTSLDKDDDVANVKWGGSWRLPTNAEWRELVDNCTLSWTSVNGVPGCKATSNINGNSIFFPAAGEKSSSWSDETFGKYWLSAIQNTSPDSAYYISVKRDSYNEVLTLALGQRCYGLSVRAVTD